MTNVTRGGLRAPGPIASSGGAELAAACGVRPPAELALGDHSFSNESQILVASGEGSLNPRKSLATSCPISKDFYHPSPEAFQNIETHFQNVLPNWRSLRRARGDSPGRALPTCVGAAQPGLGPSPSEAACRAMPTLGIACKRWLAPSPTPSPVSHMLLKYSAGVK